MCTILLFHHKYRMQSSSPDEYANAFSKEDTLVQLDLFEKDRDRATGQERANLQQFVDALKRHLASLRTNPGSDHPTREPHHLKRNALNNYILSALDAKIVDPIKEYLSDPLGPDAYHVSYWDGPNPLRTAWNALMHTPPNPFSIVRALWDVLVSVIDFVVWDIKDFIRLVRVWNGSIKRLLVHPEFFFDLAWRTMMTVLLIIGAVEIGPILLVLTEWTKIATTVLVDLAKSGVQLIEHTVGPNNKRKREES